MSRLRCLIAQPLRSNTTWQPVENPTLLHSEPRHPFGYVHVANMLLARGIDVQFINQVRPRPANVYSNPELIYDVLHASSQFDVVIGYSTVGTAIVSALSLLPNRRPGLVLYLQAQLNPGGSLVKRLSRRILFNRAIHGASATVSVLSDLTQQIKRSYPNLRGRVHYSPVGADTAFFDSGFASREPEDRNLTQFQSGHCLLVVGDATRDDQFIYSALYERALPLVRVTRDIEVAKRVERLALQYGHPQDMLLNQVSFSDLRWLYSHCNAVVFAANDSWEPAGITALTEALSCGALCICNSGGCIEREILYLAQEAHLTCPILFYRSGDSNALRHTTSAVVRLDQQARLEKSVLAREFVQRACPVERSYQTLWEAVLQALDQKTVVVEGSYE